MKRLIVSFFVILAGVFVVDRIGGLLMGWVNRHTSDITAPKIKYLVNDVDEEVLFMGTSRCNFHYVPSIISDSLGMSVYNGGIDASDNIFAHYWVLNQVLSHHTPKMICLEVMDNDYVIQSTRLIRSVSSPLTMGVTSVRIPSFAWPALIGHTRYLIFIVTMRRRYPIWLACS